uniref:uncharacterized protein LOC105350286 n=1 Tax=Fragaria vesca subsp. vesca TaxID=101020 RepID=UPI0005CB4349|nr:PREDICTED: uncharacterized protein LOC105350286 [Fragaria vesca subsp. vesca]
MLVVLIWLSRLSYLSAEVSSRGQAAAALDVLLQDHAYRSFVHPKTGVPYDAQVPWNLTGVQIAALGLRSGSLYMRGVVYKEFEFPVGVNETSPYDAERLVLVYQNLGNWSVVYYPLPGYSYLAPVLGLLAYDAINLSAKRLPYLDIKATVDPIKIKFQDVKPNPANGTVVKSLKCVTFNLDGSINFSDVGSGNTCLAVQQGHLSIAVDSIAPVTTPNNGSPPSPTPGGGSGKKKSNSKTWIIVGSVLGGLALLPFLVLWVHKYRKRKHLEEM